MINVEFCVCFACFRHLCRPLCVRVGVFCTKFTETHKLIAEDEILAVT